LSQELATFILEYQDVLKSKTYRYTAKAHQYLCGLFQAEKRNIEKICEKVVDSEMQNLNHFISESPWEWEPVIARIGEDTSRLFAGRAEKIGLLIDESGWKKAGKQSVGVGRQYLGSLGKVDNGQVAVFASLVQGEHIGIIDTRLYLPESWTTDPKRCLKAGIPSDKMAFRTKPELAVEMVRAARKRGIRYDWIGGDGLYGHDSKFRYALDDEGECYVLDVHDDERVYREAPRPYIPAKQPGRGRTPTRYQVDMEGIKAKELVKDLEESCFKEFCFRDGSKGGKRRKVFVQEVYSWNGEEATPRKEYLIVSQNLDGTDVKYSLGNEQAGRYSWCDLLYMQMQRFWVEQSIKDAKSELGMSDYQVRTWRAWHHHITLTMLALLFMLQQKLSHHEESPLLSCSDIRFILAHTLPQKVVSKADVLDMIEQRHHRRQYDLDRYAES
jgi:SRSO17 transposase